MELILASSSPRRIEFIKSLGINFKVIPSDADECVDAGLSPTETVIRIAERKADTVIKRHGGLVLGADSAVVLDGRIIGKPTDTTDAVKTLCALSGRTHEVMTGICLLGGSKLYRECAISRVTMNVLSDEFIAKYVATGSPLDKAGSYGIQDGGLVSEYTGSYTNIMGLPMERVAEILKAEGFDIKGDKSWR